MKRAVIAILVLTAVAISARAQSSDPSTGANSGLVEVLSGVKGAIERNLGRPYVWGATGMKSFDCSGFVWRVMYENGVLMKRTTARKFYMILKPAPKEEQGTFGTIVFFDDLKHMGIIDSPQTFFHAQTGAGTNRSSMNSYWKKMVYGYRQFPLP